MEIEVFETPYQVNLGKSGHFEFNSFRLNKVLFTNIRLLKGQIENIMDFLRVGTNVELVNILSRELNGFNYFDIYEDVLGEFDHPVITGRSYLTQMKSKNGLSFLLK